MLALVAAMTVQRTMSLSGFASRDKAKGNERKKRGRLEGKAEEKRNTRKKVV